MGPSLERRKIQQLAIEDISYCSFRSLVVPQRHAVKVNHRPLLELPYSPGSETSPGKHSKHASKRLNRIIDFPGVRDDTELWLWSTHMGALGVTWTSLTILATLRDVRELPVDIH